MITYHYYFEKFCVDKKKKCSKKLVNEDVVLVHFGFRVKTYSPWKKEQYYEELTFFFGIRTVRKENLHFRGRGRSLRKIGPKTLNRRRGQKFKVFWGRPFRTDPFPVNFWCHGWKTWKLLEYLRLFLNGFQDIVKIHRTPMWQKNRIILYFGTFL